MILNKDLLKTKGRNQEHMLKSLFTILEHKISLKANI